jgi:hypothetical protein
MEGEGTEQSEGEGDPGPFAPEKVCSVERVMYPNGRFSLFLQRNLP